MTIYRQPFESDSEPPAPRDFHEANRRGWDAISPTWQAGIDAMGLWQRCSTEPELVLRPEELAWLRDVRGQTVCVLGSGDNLVVFALAAWARTSLRWISRRRNWISAPAAPSSLDST